MQYIESEQNEVAEHFFLISGLSCSACVSRVEAAIKEIDGVVQVRVNLAENSAYVLGGDESAILARLQEIGYPAELLDDQQQRTAKAAELFQLSIQKKWRQSLIALGSGAALMVAHWFNLLPSYAHLGAANPLLYKVFYLFAALLVALLLYFSGGHYFRSAWHKLKQRSATMDTLVTLGVLASWLLSLVIILLPDSFTEHHLYLDSGLMVVGFVNLGKMLEEKGKKSASSALSSLAALIPQQTSIITQDGIVTIATEQVKKDMRIILKSGDSVPVDAKIASGTVWLDESLLTGESAPQKREVGDMVIAGTLISSGNAEVIATATGKQTVLARMLSAVAKAQSSKPQLANLADKVAAIFVPTVIVIAIVTFLLHWVTGGNLTQAVLAATTVLVISCPCALGLAIPMSVIAGTTQAAKLGILVRDANGLQQLAKVNTIAFDKTGTLTLGEMQVQATWQNDLTTLQALFAIEQQVTHPLANALVKFAQQQGVDYRTVDSIQQLDGLGVKAKFEEDEWLIGNQQLMLDNAVNLAEAQHFMTTYYQQAMTLVFVAKRPNEEVTAQLQNIFALADQVRDDANVTLQQLANLGVESVIISGDNQATVRALADKLNIQHIYAEVKPQQKADILEKYHQQGVVAMVGDGVNDALALSQADIAIAIGSGAKTAIETADLTLLNDKLLSLVQAVNLSKAVVKNMKLSLFFAFIYNMILIPVAAVGLLNPMYAALAMACSSLTVVANAQRLRYFN